MKRILLSLILPLFATLSLLAGQWDVYTYTDQYQRVCPAGSKLYILKGNSIVRADAATWKIEAELNREDGLSGTTIVDMCYSHELDRVAIVYDNALIDVLHPDGTIWTIPDLYQAPMAGIDKTILSVREQEGLLFIHTAYGFAVADLERDVILHNFMLPSPVKCAWAYEGNWYYSNSSGSFYCPQQGSNPHLASSWHQTGSQRIERTVVLHNAGIEQCWQMDADHRLCRIAPGRHTSVRSFDGGTITDLQRAGSYLMASAADSLVLYDTSFGLPPDSASQLQPGQRIACRQSSPKATAKVSGICPLADEGFALIYPDQGAVAVTLTSVTDRSFRLKALHNEQLTINNHQQSPEINRIVVGPEGEVAMALVPLATGYPNMLQTQGFYTTVTPEGRWTNYDKTCVTNYVTSGKSRFCGLTCLQADPFYPGRYWFSTLEDGIVGIDNGKLYERYDAASTNNGLEVNAPNCTRIGGLGFNNEGDLWCFNEGHKYGIRVLRKADGKWYRFRMEGLEKEVGFYHVCVTRRGGHHQVWGYQQFNYMEPRVFCYDYGTDVTSDADDRYCFFKTLFPDHPGAIPVTPWYGRNIFEGPDGSIWLLSKYGIYVIDHPELVFDQPGVVRQVMADVVATSMAIDASQRIWISTEDQGLLLFSPDGRQLLAQYTSANSLLSTDAVQSIAYQANTSTLWIVTPGQILTYRYSADEYDEADASYRTTAYCYPSHVDFASLSEVNVYGLQDDSAVTVSNSQGRTLQRLTAVGQLATIPTSTLPVGTYTVTATDLQGHRGPLLTFEVE